MLARKGSGHAWADNAGEAPVGSRCARKALLIEKTFVRTLRVVLKHFLKTRKRMEEPQAPTAVAQYLAKLRLPLHWKLGVDEIELPHVLACLEPIWHSKQRLPYVVRGRNIETVLDWGSSTQVQKKENVARWKGHLDKVLATLARSRR